MSEQLRFGLVGCGAHGRLLAESLAAVEGARIVAWCDPNLEAARSLAVEAATAFADIDTMLKQAPLDAVIVATAHHALAKAATAAAASGRHVFCEKPLGVSAADARPAVAAARQAGVNLMVGYCLRYDALRRRAKALLDEGAVGQVAYVVSGKGGRPLPGWRGERAAGGGQLLWVGSHMVDQALWLTGRKPTRVYAEMVRRPNGGPDGTTVFTARFEGDLLAHFDCSQDANASYDFVEIVGSAGRLRVDWMPRRTLQIHSEVIAAYREPTTITPTNQDVRPMYVEELREFVASIRERRDPAITGEAALATLDVLDAVVASAECGSAVRVG